MTNQILIGIGLILVLAVGARLAVARRADQVGALAPAGDR